MRQKSTNTEQSGANLETTGSAFSYLQSLPPNMDSPAVKSFVRGRESEIIDHDVAEAFTDSFRTPAGPFMIPVSWTLTKKALINLLGITGYEGYDEVNGVRFYAGINGDNQLTLVAVSTMAGVGCNEDLTVDESYPYYDYADPCPSNCTNRGNLKVQSGLSAMLKVAVVKEA